MSTLKLLAQISARLFNHERNRLLKELNNILVANREFNPSMNGFYWKGVLISDMPESIKHKGNNGNLHPSLYERMEAYTRDSSKIRFDADRIKQILALVIRNCTDTQDLRDALPDCFVEIIPDIAGYQRTRPEAYTIIDNEKYYQSYNNLKTKIEFYVATRLLY